MMALKKCVLSTIFGSLALAGSLILYVSLVDNDLSNKIWEESTEVSYDELAGMTEIDGNHHLFIQDSLRGSKFSAAGDALFTPVFSGFQENHGQDVRLVAKLNGFASASQVAEVLDAHDVHGVVWLDARVPREAQSGLREHYPFIAFSKCKVIDLTHPIPVKKQQMGRRIGSASLFALALISYLYAGFASWRAWVYVENRYTLLDKSMLPEETRRFFAAQSERLEKLGFKRICDIVVTAKVNSKARTFVSSDLKTIAVLESTRDVNYYKMGSITADGTYLRTCSQGESLEVKVTPVVDFEAPSDDAALGYAAHHKACLALEKRLGVERLTMDPRNVFGFLDYDNRVTGWAHFEQRAGGRPEPLPSPEEIQKERGDMKIYNWSASEWTEEELTAAGV